MTPLLITAGATRNPVDRIRYLSANATGRTGIAIAERLEPLTTLHFLGSAEAVLRRARAARCEEYWGTRDLEARMRVWCLANPAGSIVHSAAVGDYEVQVNPGKIPSGLAEVLLRLTPAPKILDQVRGWAPGCFLVSFKAAAPETTLAELEAIALAQLRRTACNLVFANVIGALESGILLVSERRTDRFDDRDSAVGALSDRVARRVNE